jgi:hypothetical protein
MSNQTTRTQLAAALSTVTGVTGYPRRPAVVKAGDAWPQWGGSERATGRGFTETWNVLVVLPPDEAAADTFADGKQDALVTALSPVIYIDSFAPANFKADDGDVYALLITGRSE